jgi:hypothetical protein
MIRSSRHNMHPQYTEIKIHYSGFGNENNYNKT